MTGWTLHKTFSLRNANNLPLRGLEEDDVEDDWSAEDGLHDEMAFVVTARGTKRGGTGTR